METAPVVAGLLTVPFAKVALVLALGALLLLAARWLGRYFGSRRKR